MQMFSDPFAQLQAIADLNAARQSATAFLAADTSLADLDPLIARLDSTIQTVKELSA